MAHLTLTDVEISLRSSWALDTCDPVDAQDWSVDNPARGQCGATTLVLHDLFGGRIADAEVWDGNRLQGHHSWLRTPGGVDLDLTREQFSDTEVVGAPRFYDRPGRRPRRCVEQYETLRGRVFERLGLDATFPEYDEV